MLSFHGSLQANFQIRLFFFCSTLACFTLLKPCWCSQWSLLSCWVSVQTGSSVQSFWLISSILGSQVLNNKELSTSPGQTRKNLSAWEEAVLVLEAMKGKHHISVTRVMLLTIQIFLRYALSKLIFSKQLCRFRMIRSCDFIDRGKFALKLMWMMGLLNSFKLEDLICANHSMLRRRAAQELFYYFCSSLQSHICALVV